MNNCLYTLIEQPSLMHPTVVSDQLQVVLDTLILYDKIPITLTFALFTKDPIPSRMNENKRILLVDDDEEDRMLIQEAFTEIGAPEVVHFETNGEDALSYLDSHLHALPYLIILDLNMPRMNGTQTLRTLKSDERYRHITVIIYSTSINPLERETCLSLGAHSYVVKPTLYQESLDTVARFHQLCEELAHFSNTAARG